MSVFFFALGLAAVVSQVLLLRELAVVFLGHEISLIIGLAAWLVWGGLGSRQASQKQSSSRSFAVLVLALGLSLPVSALLIRLSKLLLPVGALPGLVPALIYPMVLLAIPCWLFGAAFSSGLAVLRIPAGRAYSLECLGALAGGLLYTFALAGRVTALAVLTGLGPRAEKLDRATRQLEFQGYPIIHQNESRYEHLALTRLGESRVLFQNGAVSVQFPLPASEEERAHLAMLAHPKPRRVLALGVAAGPVLGEILKHPVESLDWVEQDPEAIELLGPLENMRLQIHAGDPRSWVKEHPQAYDVVFQCGADPSSAATNRFFTEEFFAQARRALRPGGLLAFEIPSSENYLPPEVAVANASILKAVRTAFPQVELLPGVRMTVLAGDKPVRLDPAQLAERLRARRIHTRVVTPDLLPYYLLPERRQALAKRLAEIRAVPSNTDRRPISYALLWRVWLAKFISPVHLLGLFTACFFAGWAILRLWNTRTRWLGNSPLIALFATGFSGMAAEIVLLLAFQSASGALYWQLGVLTASFMSGLAIGASLGAVLGDRLHVNIGPVPMFALMVTSLLTGLLAWFLPNLAAVPSHLCLAAFCLVLAAVAFPAGFLFPAAARQSKSTAGTLYAADLWGAALGAFLAGIFLIPLVGQQGTLLVAAVLPAASAISALQRPPS
jgi:spermidine synthase